MVGTWQGVRIRGIPAVGVANRLVALGRQGYRWLVLGAYIAALDAQDAGAVDADEGPGAGDLGRIV